MKTKTNGGVMMIEGAALGAVLGVVAGMLLAPESGKQLRSDISKMSGDVYRMILPKVKKMKKISEKEFGMLITEGAKKYAAAKKISLGEEAMIANEAKRFWAQVKKHA